MISGYACPHCGRSTMSPENPGAVRASIPGKPLPAIRGYAPKWRWSTPDDGAVMDCHLRCWWCDGQHEAKALRVPLILHLLDIGEELRTETLEEQAAAKAREELGGREPPVCCPTCGHRRGPLGWKPCAIHEPWRQTGSDSAYDNQGLTARFMLYGVEEFRTWLGFCWVHGLAHGVEFANLTKNVVDAGRTLDAAVEAGWIERAGLSPTLGAYTANSEEGQHWFYRPNRKCVAAHAFLFDPPEWP